MPVTALPTLPPRNDPGFAAAVEARLNAEVVFSEQLAVLEVAAARTDIAVAAAIEVNSKLDMRAVLEQLHVAGREWIRAAVPALERG